MKTHTDFEAISTNRYVSSFDVAMVHAGLGDMQNALDYLERVYDEGSHWMVFLQVDDRRRHAVPGKLGLVRVTGVEYGYHLFFLNLKRWRASGDKLGQDDEASNEENYDVSPWQSVFRTRVRVNLVLSRWLLERG